MTRTDHYYYSESSDLDAKILRLPYKVCSTQYYLKKKNHCAAYFNLKAIIKVNFMT